MQLTPLSESQQSLDTSHLSPSWLHELEPFPQTGAPASFVVSQNPLQQSVPVAHVSPSAWQGSSAQYPRMLRVVGSCPGNQNGGWLGSVVVAAPLFTSIAATHNCFVPEPSLPSV